MKFLLALLLIGSVQAAPVTLLVTGTVTPGYGYPVGTMGDGIAPQLGDTLQFKYTVDDTANPTQDPSQLGPIVSIGYSINGSEFQSDNGWGVFSVTQDSDYIFTLYPGNGAEITLRIVETPQAPPGVISSNDFETVPNWALVAQAPPGSVTGTMLVYDLSGAGAYATITNVENITPIEQAPAAPQAPTPAPAQPSPAAPTPVQAPTPVAAPPPPAPPAPVAAPTTSPPTPAPTPVAAPTAIASSVPAPASGGGSVDFLLLAGLVLLKGMKFRDG
jgi:hypothetical protein